MRDRPRTELSIRARWAVLACYVAAIYATLPFGPRVGLRILRTGPGGWLLGPGLMVLVAGAALTLALALHRRRAPASAYAMLALAAVGYALALSSLRAHHLERTHLPEYGVAAWLAWRAVDPLLPGPWGYAAGAALASAVGYGDELLQAVVPGRYYDLRDVAMNAVGALLGVLVVAALRAGDARHKAVVPRGSAEIASPP